MPLQRSAGAAAEGRPFRALRASTHSRQPALFANRSRFSAFPSFSTAPGRQVGLTRETGGGWRAADAGPEGGVESRDGAVIVLDGLVTRGILHSISWRKERRVSAVADEQVAQPEGGGARQAACHVTARRAWTLARSAEGGARSACVRSVRSCSS